MNYLNILIHKIEYFNKKRLIKCVKTLFKFNRTLRKFFVSRIKSASNIVELELIRLGLVDYIQKNVKLDLNDLTFISKYAIY